MKNSLWLLINTLFFVTFISVPHAGTGVLISAFITILALIVNTVLIISFFRNKISERKN